MTPDLEKRLEAVEEVLEELRELNEDTPILVEGEKDERALRALGFAGTIIRINNVTGSVFNVVETVGRKHRSVILLMDWDRFGGHLTKLLIEACDANGVARDIEHRRALARATRKEITQVEALDTYLDNLRARVGRQ